MYYIHFNVESGENYCSATKYPSYLEAFDALMEWESAFNNAEILRVGQDAVELVWIELLTIA